MADVTFRLDRTGLLVVDPYNDFISDGGKLWPRVREVVEANGCVPHMIEVLQAALSAGVRIFFATHRRWRAGDYETWKFWAPIQEAAARSKVFADGSWGGTFRDEFAPQPGDIVAQEHWCSSGFANTDTCHSFPSEGLRPCSQPGSTLSPLDLAHHRGRSRLLGCCSTRPRSCSSQTPRR
jgi:ureidoacrylate peracid hydrolase